MSQPVLARFERDVWRNKVGDSAQVPAAGATLAFYHQGATASGEDTPVPPATDPPEPPTKIDVYDRGTIQAGDVVQVGTIVSSVLYVAETPDRQTLMVENSSLNEITVVNHIRLFRKSAPATVHADPHGLIPLGSSVVVPADGRIAIYVAVPRFDYIITGGGISVPRSHIDALGGTTPTPSWLNVYDFASLHAAVASLPAIGGEVFLPAGTYVLPSTLLLNKPNITLRGQGLNTIITGPPNPGFDLVKITQPNCRLLDLAIDGNASSAAPGKSCLVIAGTAVDHVYLKSLLLRRASAHGLLIQDVGSVVALNFECGECMGDGVRILRTGALPLKVRLVSGTASGNMGAGVGIAGLVGDAVTLFGCALKSNLGPGLDVSDAGTQAIGCRFMWDGSGTAPDKLLYARGVSGMLVEGCWFDGRSGSAPNKAVRGAVFYGCKGAAFMNNVGENLRDTFVEFLTGLAGVEMGNRELDFPDAPRIVADLGHAELFSLSRGVVSPYEYSAAPAGFVGPEGAMVWAADRLKVWDGTSWRDVQTA